MFVPTATLAIPLGTIGCRSCSASFGRSSESLAFSSFSTRRNLNPKFALTLSHITFCSLRSAVSAAAVRPRESLLHLLLKFACSLVGLHQGLVFRHLVNDGFLTTSPARATIKIASPCSISLGYKSSMPHFSASRL